MKEIRRDWVSKKWNIWCARFASSWMPSIANDRGETSRRDESLDSNPKNRDRYVCVSREEDTGRYRTCLGREKGEKERERERASERVSESETESE